MKIAITGHTYGIGKELSTKFFIEGWQVVGFSRSNGYDISKPEDRARIIEQSQDCDFFINNAYSTYAQCELLFELWQAWQGKQKRIINMSSSIVGRWQNDFRDIKYRNAKVALEDACDFLTNKSEWPNVMVVRPCLTDTPTSKPNTKPNKVDPGDFADYFYNSIDKDLLFRVQSFGLAVKGYRGFV
jgi:NAD(P)-dependent dehydrogenase (short-subunit alcohol dehydrogenase family)